jgi:hypothetical protein
MSKKIFPRPGIEPGAVRDEAHLMRAHDVSHYTNADCEEFDERSLLYRFQNQLTLELHQ